MAGSFRRYHAHVHDGGRDDLLEVNVEPVGEEENLARTQVRRDRLLVEARLHRIRRKHHDEIGLLGHCFRGAHAQPVALNLRP